MAKDDINELKSLIGVFVGETQKIVSELSSTIQEHASRGIQLLDLETKRQELAEAQSALGRAIFERCEAGEMTLPEPLLEHLDQIRALSVEVDTLQTAADTEETPEDEAPQSADGV